MFQLKNISGADLKQFYADFAGEKTFLQSAQYAQLRASLGETILTFGIFKKETLVGTVIVQIIKTKFKKYAHVPHGPITNEGDDFWAWFLAQYKDIGREHQCDFVRISPLLADEKVSVFKTQKYQPATIHLVNPEKTWCLDLEKDEDTLLAEMKKSTRYEVRKGLKAEFEVRIGNTKEDLDVFWALHEETVARQKFVPFPRSLTEKEMTAFGSQAQIISILHEKKPLASGVFLFDDRAGYYHQGASTYSKLPAAHAYLWQAILESKRRGCAQFNFWGVCGEDEKAHPWYGLSKFKRGFGGTEKNYLHVQDFPLTKKYWLNTCIEKYRRWKRGY